MILRYSGPDSDNRRVVVPGDVLWHGEGPEPSTTTSATPSTSTEPPVTSTTTAITTSTSRTTTTTSSADTELVAYWDHQHCGPYSDNHNWHWCNHARFQCADTVEVPRNICSSHLAALVDARSFVEVNGCPYAYYARYECKILTFKFDPLPASNQCMNQPPQGWANLGTGLTQAQCHDRCVPLESCSFVTFWSAGGACTSFEACDSTVSKTWTKPSGSERRLRKVAQTWAKVVWGKVSGHTYLS